MKNNKGITLIALVVTIIILLILAGVSITTLSGNGLFGRAESSAAKYQQASEAENSTISSILDKFDEVEGWQNETDTIPVSWDAPIATRGTFINNLNPESSRSSNLYDKQIVAIKPSGTKVLLNPYQATNLMVPNGTILRFYYYVDTATTGTETIVEDLRGSYARRGSGWHETRDGSLQYVDVAIRDCLDVRLTLGTDGIENGLEDATYSIWLIKYSETLPAMMTVKWTSPIAEKGSFINNLSPDTPRESNFLDKQIVAIKPDGTKQILNPYQATSVTVPRGTVFRFYMYATKDVERSVAYGMIYNKNYARDGGIMYADWSEDLMRQNRGGFIARKDYQFYLQSDYVGDYQYTWCVDLEPHVDYVE